MQQVLIRNQTRPDTLPIQARYCSSFLCRLTGLMFRSTLGLTEGLLMVQPSMNRMDAAIHMFFMNFDITTVWLDNDLRVVDARLCQRWRPAYIPRGAARYVLEIHAARKDDYQVGDQLLMETC